MKLADRFWTGTQAQYWTRRKITLNRLLWSERRAEPVPAVRGAPLPALRHVGGQVAAKHPECVKGNHQWLTQRAGSAEVEVCVRCGEVRPLAPRKGKTK